MGGELSGWEGWHGGRSWAGERAVVWGGLGG